jgi:hypothetical protein
LKQKEIIGRKRLTMLLRSYVPTIDNGQNFVEIISFLGRKKKDLIAPISILE